MNPTSTTETEPHQQGQMQIPILDSVPELYKVKVEVFLQVLSQHYWYDITWFQLQYVITNCYGTSLTNHLKVLLNTESNTELTKINTESHSDH